MADKTKVFSKRDKNVDYMNQMLPVEDSFDIVQRDIQIGGKDATFYFIDGFTKDESMLKIMDSFFNIKEGDMPKDAAAFATTCIPYVEVDVIGRRAVHAGLGVRDHGPDGGGLGLRLVGERARLIVAEDVGGRSVDVLVRRPDRERVAEDAVDGARAEFDDGVDFGEAPRHVGLGRSRSLARQGEEAGEEDVGVEARMDADGEDRVVEEVGHGRCSSVSAQRARIQAG